MYKLVIQGGKPLQGAIKASGSKNSSLPILFASILADGPITLNNTPQLSDISTTLRLLMSMGADFILESNSSLFVDSSKLNNLVADYNLVKTMRASILVLGPMLTKYGEAKVSLPGGCAIGTRPVNLHLKALEELGASISVGNGYIYAKTDGLIGANIHFDQVTVTATENVIMAATLAKGTSIIVSTDFN
jgi:UDP-N-acetylglucosamine 1-carboxyvinyltransferase